jgi:C4-dicarboxylate transporter, DctM subunit
VLTDVPERLVNLISTSGLPAWGVLGLIVVLYLVLGMILDSIGMTLLTLPFIFPIIQHLGVDPILFGVILIILTEVGLLTPPVGMNCYILNHLVPELKLSEIFIGVIPFLVICLLVIAFFMAYPEIVLWLPNKAF